MANIPGYANGFNAKDVEPATGSPAPLPEDDYAVLIDRSEVKQTRKGDGEYLSLRLKVIEGDYEGRFVFLNLNLVNPSDQAMDIARRQFSAICHATGVLTPEDSTELHGIPMIARVKIRPATDSYPATNDVASFKAYDHGDAPW